MGKSGNKRWFSKLIFIINSFFFDILLELIRNLIFRVNIYWKNQFQENYQQWSGSKP
jgi:hypothetical protein